MRGACRSWLFFAGFVLISSVAAGQLVSVTVSPGDTTRAARIAETCPTFNWGTVEGATAYELAVLRQAEVPELGAELEVLFQITLPGSAHGWTPSLERCLERGSIYAWTVRARLGGGASDWAEASVFEVSRLGSTAEVRDVTGSEGVDLSVAQDVRGVAVEHLKEQALEGGGAEDALHDETETDRTPKEDRLTRRQGRGVRRGQQALRSAGRKDFGREHRRSTAAATAPSSPNPSLTVSNDISLSAASNIFKDGDLLLWDDGLSGNLAIGVLALGNNTEGTENTATGRRALHNNTTGYWNTALGADALFLNTTGRLNTASGTRALRNNDIGSYNTASGTLALNRNTGGRDNTASGFKALYSNTTGGFNTASGTEALASNTTGGFNTASGTYALFANTTGSVNTARGFRALYSNTTGLFNTASGAGALAANTTGGFNTASGTYALSANTTGLRNTAVGHYAGQYATTGWDNIFLGSGAYGVDGEANTIRIGGTSVGTGAGQQNRTFINGINGVSVGAGNMVYINSAGQLGTTVSSSIRFKEDVEDLGELSAALMDLRPVRFHYKNEGGESDPGESWGLIAEEVAEVFPELVHYGGDGKPSGVRYSRLIPLLLNELQKQFSQIAELSARLSKLEASK